MVKSIISVPKLMSFKLLSCSLINRAGTVCTPFRWSFRYCWSSFLFNLSSTCNPFAARSTFSFGTVISLNGLIPPLHFFLPAGPARTILQRSARERWRLLQQYTKSRYQRESLLQEMQPLCPPLCSPLSNWCSSPSPWKKRITCTTGTPLLVCRLLVSWSKHSLLVST